jgi:hypothetical protein
VLKKSKNHLWCTTTVLNKYETYPNNIPYNLRFLTHFFMMTSGSLRLITRTSSSVTIILFQTNRTSSPLSLKYMKNGDWQVIKNQIPTQYWNLIQPFCTRKSLSKSNIKNQKLKTKWFWDGFNRRKSGGKCKDHLHVYIWLLVCSHKYWKLTKDLNSVSGL